MLTSKIQGPHTLQRPHCPKCNTRASLVEIGPGSNGSDRCIFECSTCGETFELLVPADPMQADTAKWIDGGLSPPE